MLVTLEDWKKAKQEVYEEAWELTAELSAALLRASQIEMICAVLEQEAREKENTEFSQ